MTHEIASTCCYCGTGCGVLIETDGTRIVGVRGDPKHPANFGKLCSKGASLHQTVSQPSRLLYPERRAQRAQPGQKISWDAALDDAAKRFAEVIRTHGPDAVAFYISGQLLTEDYYVFNKLAKGLVGTNNVDTNSRLCMSSAVAGYKQTLGMDSVPTCYEDIDHADVLFIAGANPAVAHPIVFRRIEEAKAANPKLKIIVADPRRSESAEIADLHLPLAPGSDIALFNGMLHVLLRDGLVNRAYIEAHTEGFAALEEIVAGYPPEVTSALTGLDPDAIEMAAHWFGKAGASLSMYCQGLNQSAHGTHNNAALIHLHLATAQIGRPGAGPFSLTGQPNAMGGREVGGVSNLLPAHRDLANPEHRAEIASFWGVPSVPDKPGKPAVEMFRALKRGEIKAIWIACTNPAQSLPDQAEVREALKAAEFVVLQETFGDTDTADYADLLLPATGWGEKEGTVTNSERRITRVRAATDKPGETRHDWDIVVDFARRLGQCLGKPDVERMFDYPTPESIFNEHRETTRGRDLDITGLSYAMLEQAGPQQWPLPEGAKQGVARLYADGCFPTPSGKARFVKTEHLPLAEPTSAEYPLSLLSGRLRDQWHGMSRTGTVPRLFNPEDEPLLHMSPKDMKPLGLKSGDLARIRSPRGSMVVRVAGDGAFRGRVWLPMHWGNRFMNGAGANAFTPGACDPYSAQPELKHAPVAVEAVDLSWPLVVIRRADESLPMAELMQCARSLLPRFDYAVATPGGRAGQYLLFRAACAEALPLETLNEIDALFGLDGEQGLITYADLGRSIHKRVRSDQAGFVGVRLAGEAQAMGWIKEAMAAAGADASLLRWAVAPVSAPPSAVPARARVVCKCADVTEPQIVACLNAGESVAGVQERLKCGTYCGSCLPEIKRMAQKAA